MRYSCGTAPARRLINRVNLQVTTFLLWWGGWDSNPRPTDYESAALTG